MEAAAWCACAALCALAAWVWSRRGEYALARRLPGSAWALPLVGHTHLFFGYDQESLFARLRSVLESDLREYPYIKLWLGPQLVALVTDANCVKRIIYNRSLLHKGDLLHAADPVVGNGMLFGSGPEVKRRRRGILPSLKMKMLERYLEVFHRHSATLQRVLEELVVDGEEFHLEEHLHHCSFDAVNETTINVRTDTLRGQNRNLVKAFIEVYGLLYQEIVKPWLYLGRKALNNFGFQFRTNEICRMLDTHIGEALKRERTRLQTEQINEEEISHKEKSLSNENASREKFLSSHVSTDKSPNGHISSVNAYSSGHVSPHNGGADILYRNGRGTKSHSIQNGGTTTDKMRSVSDKDGGAVPEIISTLEYMLRSEFEISDEDLIVEMKNIFLASSDTVATICSFLFKMFAVHPDYQERAHQEAVRVLGDGRGVPLASELARLEFLERCLKETLRLFPIAPLIPRKCEEPLQLDDAMTLPAGTTLLVGAFWLHRSPKYWQKPELFYPDHFSPEFQAGRHPAAFIPFSGGPHSCIGQQYAMFFMKIVAALVLLKFRVGPVDQDYVDCPYDHSVAKDSAANGRPQNGEAVKRNVTNVSDDSSQDGGQSEISKLEGQNRGRCQRKGCQGRYIHEDYVSDLILGTDISVRLVGGVRVKMFRRNMD